MPKLQYCNFSHTNRYYISAYFCEIEVLKRVKMPIFWDGNLIVLSVLTAIYGSFAALSHAERMRSSSGKSAMVWMIAGGITLGLSIWSMHFIGMLAFHLPVSITYDLSLTFVSVIPAILATLLGFYILRNPKIHLGQIMFGGLMMGLAISTMHYTGMEALKMQPAISYDPVIFVLSLLIAVVAAIGALVIIYAGEKSNLNSLVRHALGSLIMGLAIAGMHYTGMAAANFAVGSVCTVEGSSIQPTLLSFFIAGIVFLLVTGGWVANLLDRRMVRENAAALIQLSKQTKELEIDRDILEKINSGKTLHVVLNDLVKQVEVQHPEMICTILLLDKDNEHLMLAAAPSMPDAYNNALDGIQIGEGVGSCGTAAFSGQRVIVEDVTKHPYWAPYQHLVALGNFRACWAQPIKNYENRVLGTFAIYHDAPTVPDENELSLIERYAHLAQLVLERKEQEDEISYIAFHDPLTRLPNRRLLIDRLQQALDASDRTGRYGAVIFIDLDNFKSLNDTKGHDIGDLMLSEVANRLIEHMRKGDTVARLGGDEFIVMTTDLGEDYSKSALQTELTGEKILSILSQPFVLDGYEHYCTASIGISMFCGNALSVGNLLKHADTAMYQSKHAGRNTLHFFDPSMQEAIEARLSMQNDLRNAISENQFKLYYQVQVDSQNKIMGAEALIRWDHPIRGQVSPMEFIPIAEETGAILQIGHYVLLTACRQLKAWESNPETKDLCLAINVSLYQFKQPGFVKEVKAVLNETKANPKNLKIELTESMLVENVDEIIKKMQKLQSIGVRFSLDDFGTGYSSLASIKHLPIFQLKIDKSFVNDIAINPSEAAIAKTIIAMGNILGLNVIAEGVENEAQFEILKKYDCPMFQGYLFGKPMPIDELELLIQRSIEADSTELRLTGTHHG